MFRGRVASDEHVMTARKLLASATSPVLAWESQREFECLRRLLANEVKPDGVVEEMYVADAIAVIWEILRMRLFKREKLDRAYQQKIVEELQEQYGDDEEQLARIEKLAAEPMGDRKYQKLLKQASRQKIDLRQIELSVLDDLSQALYALDRAIASAEERRHKLLVRVAQYRKIFAKKMELSINKLLDTEKELKANGSGDNELKRAN